MTYIIHGTKFLLLQNERIFATDYLPKNIHSIIFLNALL